MIHTCHRLSSSSADAGALPDILCVIQVCLEGEISKDSVAASMARGERASGDLIPWTVSQQFQVRVQVESSHKIFLHLMSCESQMFFPR